MSEIANINVVRCDGEDCQVIFVIQSEQDRDTFEAAWFAGLNKDLCPACKDAFANQAVRVEQEQRIAAMASAAKVTPIRPLTFSIVDEEPETRNQKQEASDHGNAAA